MSFLEMFDYLNQELINKGEEPIAFDSDCREGICGMCSMWINGRAHGPVPGVTTCQLHMFVLSKTVKRLLWNHGEQNLFLSLKI
jgi:succinate dehydrogenase/fumarate reductase-like Fe-S protein